jgi:hypothetical protein
MRTVIAAIIWGVVNSTMICKTSSGATSIQQHNNDSI